MVEGGEDDDVLAAEYVIGLLTVQEAAIAHARAAQAPDFEEKIRYWEERFTALALTAKAEPVSPKIWRDIRKSLDFASRAARWSGSDAMLLFAMERQARSWRRVAVSAMLGAAVLVLASSLSLYVSQQRGTIQYIAAVSSSTRQPTLLVTLDARTGQVVVIPAALSRPEGRSLELWLIPQGKAPLPLGLLKPESETRIEAKSVSEQTLSAPAVLAVSLEPEGGSPTGAPTGPVILTGNLLQTRI